MRRCGATTFDLGTAQTKSIAFCTQRGSSSGGYWGQIATHVREAFMKGDEPLIYTPKL
jgi:hypothetical protein